MQQHPRHQHCSNHHHRIREMTNNSCTGRSAHVPFKLENQYWNLEHIHLRVFFSNHITFSTSSNISPTHKTSSKIDVYFQRTQTCRFCIFPDEPNIVSFPYLTATRVDHETVAIDVSRFVASLPWVACNHDDNDEKKTQISQTRVLFGGSWNSYSSDSTLPPKQKSKIPATLYSYKGLYKSNESIHWSNRCRHWLWFPWLQWLYIAPHHLNGKNLKPSTKNNSATQQLFEPTPTSWPWANHTWKVLHSSTFPSPSRPPPLNTASARGQGHVSDAPSRPQKRRVSTAHSEDRRQVVFVAQGSGAHHDTAWEKMSKMSWELMYVSKPESWSIKVHTPPKLR